MQPEDAAISGGAAKYGVELGTIGRPYGVRGWCHVHSYTEPAERLLSYEVWQLVDRDGVATLYRREHGRRQGRSLVVCFRGVADRDAAARLTGAAVCVAREDMPALQPGEYYLAELVGLVVENLEGVELGVVDHFIDAPANPVMVVKGQREHWVPATRAHLRRVDRVARRISVDWPADL